MKNKDMEGEVQGLLVEAENYKRHMDGLSAQIQMMESVKVELNSSMKALSYIKQEKPGTEILVPLGYNSFIRSELKDTKKVLIGVGGGIATERDIGEAEKILEKRDENLDNTLRRLQENLVEASNKLNSLEGRYRQLMQATAHK